MTTQKTTTKKPPEPKTPTDNAESGVICHVGPGCPVCDPAGRAPLTFTGYNSETSPGELPEPRSTMESVGPLADVFHASGYFGDLTPAQIAVHIIAGRSLGLDDAQSVFDLEIKPGPTIVYKQAQTYQNAADGVEKVKSTVQRLTANRTEPAPLATPDAALPDDNVKSGVVVDGGFRKLDDPALADALTEFAITGDPSALIEPVEPLRDRENADFDENPVDLANKAPVLNSEPADDLNSVPAPNLSSAAPKLESSGVISDEPLPEVSPVPDRDGPPTPADLVRWRSELLKMMGELGLDVARVMNEYDGLDVEAKRQKVDSAWNYYELKVSTIRDMIRDGLAADGKPTLDSQAGFYMFADVPGNPDNWTYPQAQQAERALVEFFKRPTAPAA